MNKAILSVLALAVLATPALAASYPVSGQWGESNGATPGATDCSGKRVMTFNGNQRTDTGGGVSAYQNHSVTADGPSQYRVVDEFSNGMISTGRTSYTLRQVDNDHIEMRLQQGGTLTLQRCK